jgi:hypothetical protein
MPKAVRRAAGPVALVLTAGLVLPTGVALAEPSVVFEVVTTAVGVSVSSTQRPAASVITGGLVDSSTGYSSSALSSAGASASASAAFYPGDLVAGGPTLLCSEFLPCPVSPPAYPLLAQASWPERPAASADSPAPVGSASAAAHELATDGRTEVASESAPGTPVAIATGAQATTTRAWADDAGGHVRSTSTLHDVVVGPLHIAILTATDAVDVTPAGRVTDRPRVELGGVNFAGLAASIDDEGVHLVGVTAPLPARTLAEHGVEVRALGTTRSDGKGAARSTAGGLQVTFSAPVQGVPPVVPGLPSLDRSYLGSVTIGGVGAAVGVGAPGEPLLAALPAAPASSLDARLLPPQRLGGQPIPAAGLTSVPAGAPAPDIVAVGRRRPVLPPADLRWLALALAVVPTSLLIGWRVAARWRTS